MTTNISQTRQNKERLGLRLIANQKESLLGHREYFRWLLDNTSNVILIIDMEGTILYVNDAVEKTFGYKPEEVLGKNNFSFVHPEDLPKVKASFTRGSAEFGKKEVIELRCRHKDSTWRYVQTAAQIMTNENGGQEGLIISKDITEQKNTKIALQDSQIKWDILVKTARDVISIISEDGVFTYVSPSSEEIFGYKPEELVNRNFSQLFHPDDRHLFFDTFQKAFTDQDFKELIQYRAIHKNGSQLHLESLPRSITDISGKREMMVITRDITEKKEADLEIQKSEEKFRSLFENVLDGVYQSSTDGKWLTVNPAMVRMLGYDSVEELLASDIPRDVYINPNDRRDWMNSIEKEGQLMDVEIRFKRKDGSIITVLDNARAVRDEGGNLLYYEGILTDITKLKEAANALKRGETNLTALIENTKDAIWSIDRNYSIVIINSSFQREFRAAYGVTLEKGMGILEHLDEEARKNWKSFYDRALEGERFHIEQYFSYSGKDKYVEVHFNPIATENGEITGVSVFGHDVTESKKAFQALRSSEEQYRSLVENAPIGILSIDTQGNILDINPKVLEILGSPSVEATRQINVLTFQPLIEAGITEDILKCIEKGEAVSNEREYISKWGKKLFLHYICTPIRGQNGDIVKIQGIVEDVSESRKAVDQLFESYKYLGVINRKLGILLNVGKQGSEKNDQEILDFIMSCSQELSNAKLTLLYKYNHSLNRLKLIFSRGEEFDVGDIRDLTVDSGHLLQKLIEQRIRVQGNDYTCRLNKFIENGQLNYILGLPMIQDKEIHGALFLGFQNQTELTTQELDFYEVFAMQATHALVNGNII